MRVFLVFLAATGVVFGQRPEVFPGGVVNAASYATGGRSGKAVAQGSIVSIFGRNLATVTQSADSFPVPAALGGTSVRVNGIASPILFVSPGQINIQFSPGPTPAGGNQMIVTTSAGASDPVPIDLELGQEFGIFTLDGSGCGRGAVFNVAADGSVSLNSPSNSASPGDFITVYGTGLIGFFNAPPDGTPAAFDPPALAVSWSNYLVFFELPDPHTIFVGAQRISWAGRAPGFVGLDQVNVRIPETVREGCAVPILVKTNGRSQPVPISIRRGGGACVDPPSAGYGQIVWERTVTRGSTSTISETFTAAFPASPGRRAPDVPEFRDGSGGGGVEYFGASCPIPGYRGLDAGVVTIRGTAFGPVEPERAIVDGYQVYRAALPAGTIQPGSFRVDAAGGSDIGAFQSDARIGSGITVTSSFPPGTVLRSRATGGSGITVNWTGGDPDTWLTMRIVTHLGYLDDVVRFQTRTSRGGLTTFVVNRPGPAELILEVTPDPQDIGVVSAPGLSLGGQHSWKYTYRFTGLRIE